MLLLPAGVVAAPVRVFAASSLTGAMTAIADAFAATGQPRPVLVFQGSPALARQVIAGAPAAVLVTADAEWMDVIARAGLVTGRRNIAGNRLVLVVPADRPRSARLVRGFDLAGFVGSGRWTTGDPDSVPVGRYARAALTALGAWDAAAPKLARAENVRAALAYVERGDAAAGVVYATDAQASAGVHVAGVFPAASHTPITYPAALVTANADAGARAFFAFLTGPRARAILLAEGFTTP
ncbi:MAG: molybdate ABC transporter substrate-binding protein [Polymorphobacter sp.]